MKKRALFVEFDDSFSYNVVQELFEIGLDVTVINWKELTLFHEADLFVLGPGPGHPDDYEEIYSIVESWLGTQEKIFAVCLGHQILWRLMGFEVQRSLKPLHGQKVQITLTPDWQKCLELPSQTWVQRYNSLAVMSRDGIPESVIIQELDGEIILSRSKNFISYQFHPESMGTKCRESFFSVIHTNLL